MKFTHNRIDGAGIKTTVTFTSSEALLHEALKIGAENESIPHEDISAGNVLGVRLDQPMNDPASFIKEWYLRIGSVSVIEVVDTPPL